MNSSQFKKNELKKFCAIIGFKPIYIDGILDNINAYYNEWIEKKKDKKTNQLKTYKDGTVKERIIRPSLNELKIVQSKIKERILAPILLPDCVHGGVNRRSNISNAKPHQGNKYQFTTDLQEFYPNISSQKVYDAFIKLNFSPHFSHWLTKLTTWKYELPQGTPTSTHIANLVFLETDLELIKLCNSHGLVYTRFIDDLTFSSQQDFRHLLNEILDIIKSADYKLNYRKTHYKGNQTITGINVFLNRIDGTEPVKQKSRIEIKTNAESKPYTNYLNNILRTNKKNQSPIY